MKDEGGVLVGSLSVYTRGLVSIYHGVQINRETVRMSEVTPYGLRRGAGRGCGISK